jgi:hypothetical protein
VQTFLPYPEFDRSAASLDSQRLGKQRVETLQILRALTFSTYGWANHPAKVMWQGYVPLLASYGIAMTDEWMRRGGADSTRAQIAEFAPEALTVPAAALPQPSWLGNLELHRSHQSNLIRKDHGFYGPQFPGVPDDLPYYWPGADEGAPAPRLVGTPLVIVRPRDDRELADFLEHGEVRLGESSPRGRRGPKWNAQRVHLAELPIGTRIALLDADRLHVGELAGDADFERAEDGSEALRRIVRWDGLLARSSFPYPALLQDPRAIFEVPGPAA